MRATASTLFAIFSLYVWRTYGHLHFIVLGRLSEFVGIDAVRVQLVLADRELFVAYHGSAVVALIWCIWSWRTESRVAAAIATLFTGLAMFVWVVR